jgi:hypothetical protein
MPLNVAQLQTAIKAAFDAASAPVKQTPSQAPDPNQLPKDLAAAINAFIKSADIVNINVQVTDAAGNSSGLTGKQSGVGQVQ